MPQKEVRSGSSLMDSNVNLQRIERFLRLLTWQMFFVIVLLAYLILRPQTGRYQLVPPFTIAEGKVVMFDTMMGTGQLTTIQTQGPEMLPGESPAP